MTFKKFVRILEFGFFEKTSHSDSLFLIFCNFLAAFDEKKPNQIEAKTDRKPGQHPADDRDSDDEMEGEAVDKKEKKPVFKSIVNEIF